MWHMGDGWGWWLLVSSLMMIGFWLAVIWIVAMVLRRPPPHGEEQGPRAEPTALEILERRWAKGELTDDEFEAKKQRLSG
jgi:putative membrane protein